jgi:peptidoglycan/xylan/chitin deacetylase (PgdA/CDA1 family)
VSADIDPTRMQPNRQDDSTYAPSRVSSTPTFAVRNLILHIARILGGFALAQFLTRKRLRILCYHGFSLGDEYGFSPMMFMRAETFERRMAILKRRHIEVISLKEGIIRLKDRRVSAAQAVITLDDGWASNLTVALPILERYGYPACVYLSTEHIDAGTEAFDMAVAYMIHTTSSAELILRNAHPLIDGRHDLQRDRLSAAIKFLDAARRIPLPQRQMLLSPIAAALGHDLGIVFRLERFRLMDRSQIREIFRRGIDIQLHTHTHHLPDESQATMTSEIERNRQVIQDILGVRADHFCYPSGRYTTDHPAWLRKLGVESATTCDPGLNGTDTSTMLLRRYLDSDRFSDISFEAEISGFRELARIARSFLQ